MSVDKMIEEGKKIQDIVRTHKRELQKIQKSGSLELSKKAEDDLYQWASNNGEIHGDEEDEFWDWIDKNVDDLVKGRIREDVNEAKAPKIKGLSIYGSEISGLKNKKGRPHTVKPLADKGKLAFRVTDEFGSFKTVDLKTFAKEFG